MKRIIYKTIILTIIFIISFLYFNVQTKEDIVTLLDERMTSDLPFILVDEGNILYNDLHGYKQKYISTSKSYSIINEQSLTNNNKNIISGVPVIPQYPELPRGCEVVSLIMLLNFYGIEANKMQLADELIRDDVPYTITDNMISYGDMHKGFVGDMHNINNPGIGAYHEPVQALMETYIDKDNIHNLTGTELEDLYYYLDKNIPIWINVANNYNEVPENLIHHWLTPNGIMEISYTEHAVVIVGYNENYIYYNDPSKAIMDRKPISEFKNAYDQYGKQALIIIK
ncbi:MAG: C39 family peptidase [Eubacteriales bacterium]